MTTSLSAHDPRILRELSEAFPGSPEFADYLTKRICATNGSLALARLLSHCLLKDFPKTPFVKAELVNRLGVDEDNGAIGRLNQFQLERRSGVLASAMYFRLSIEAERGTVDFAHIEDYHHIFWCAYAMISGLEIDPRKAHVA